MDHVQLAEVGQTIKELIKKQRLLFLSLHFKPGMHALASKKDAKPRILLVVSSLFKAEGQMALGIQASLPGFEFYFFSILETKYRLDEFKKLCAGVHCIHWLVNLSNVDPEIVQFSRGCTAAQIATIHHVCPEESFKLKAVQKVECVHVVADEWLNYVSSKMPGKKVLKAGLGVSDIEAVTNRRAMSAVTKPFVLGMMGFYPGEYNRKRPDVAFSAFRLLKEKGLVFKVLLQGAGWEKFSETLDALEIDYTVNNYTSKRNSHVFWERIDLFVCSSDVEGGPLPVLESLAAGIPVLSTKVGAAMEALQDGGGILVDKGNAKQMADALAKMMCEKDHYTTRQKEASKHRKKYHWDTLKEEYTRLYNTALKRKPGQAGVVDFNGLNAKKQRRRELAYGQVQEGLSLLYYGEKKVGFGLVLKSLINLEISWARKGNTLKRVLRFLATGVRT